MDSKLRDLEILRESVEEMLREKKKIGKEAEAGVSALVAAAKNNSNK
jgi:hypothetical protein